MCKNVSSFVRFRKKDKTPVRKTFDMNSNTGCVFVMKDMFDPQVCGSDGKTYENSCELENVSCRKYWDIRVVSMVSIMIVLMMTRDDKFLIVLTCSCHQGPCQSSCPGVDLGMFTGFGLSRASNNGRFLDYHCYHVLR